MKKNIKGWLKFIIGYHFIPTAGTFYFLADYTNIVLAYIIACTLWGSVIYRMKK